MLWQRTTGRQCRRETSISRLPCNSSFPTEVTHRSRCFSRSCNTTGQNCTTHVDSHRTTSNKLNISILLSIAGRGISKHDCEYKKQQKLLLHRLDCNKGHQCPWGTSISGLSLQLLKVVILRPVTVQYVKCCANR